MNILESIKKIENYSGKFSNADEFYEDSISFDATMMNFIVIGEMVEKLSPDLLLETGEIIDWFKVKGFRNIIAHNYFGIDAEEVWQIIHGSLDDFKKELEKLIQ
ncbi:MAG TPA: HepT-like ribonuclease domain-containing protein [Sunxiuqinia sp.]|nr:HepT-like ribonuclease domain-containing protein [Sunxiuqinia sp.]